MRTDAPGKATSLPERDLLRIGLSQSAIRVRAGAAPFCRILFRLSLMNTSSESLRLIGRKWVLRNSSDETHIIEAAGIFNQQPVLRPGDVFSYSGCQDFSAAPPRAMELRLFGCDQSNRPFISLPLVFPRRCLTIPQG